MVGFPPLLREGELFPPLVWFPKRVDFPSADTVMSHFVFQWYSHLWIKKKFA